MNLEHIPRQLQLTRVDVNPSVMDKGASSSHDCISRSMQDAMSPLFWNRNGVYDSECQAQIYVQYDYEDLVPNFLQGTSHEVHDLSIQLRYSCRAYSAALDS